VDTYCFESLYLTLWDLLFAPLTPNALALTELKLQGHLVWYDLYGGIPDSFIIENDLNKPYKNPNPPTNLYIVGTNEMRERGIPFLISDYHTLLVASPKDVGLFRKILQIIWMLSSLQWSLLKSKHVNVALDHRILNLQQVRLTHETNSSMEYDLWLLIHWLRIWRFSRSIHKAHCSLSCILTLRNSRYSSWCLFRWW